MREILFKLGKSLSLTLTISGITGALASYAGSSFLLWFWIALVMQYFLFYCFNTFLEIRAKLRFRELQLKELEILAATSTKINCAACKSVNDVVININSENKFECSNCKVKNSVYITIEPAVVTEPLQQ